MSRPWSALGKRVAITGAGSGIGRALAQTLSRAGAKSLLCLDNNLESCRKTVESLGNTNAVAAQCDAANRTSLQAALRASDTIDLLDYRRQSKSTPSIYWTTAGSKVEPAIGGTLGPVAEIRLPTQSI